MKGKTFYLKKSERDLSNSNYPSAGPYPNIRGMREKYWGFNCDIAIQGAYIYKLT